jgi:hypothetical protein
MIYWSSDDHMTVVRQRRLCTCRTKDADKAYHVRSALRFVALMCVCTLSSDIAVRAADC